MTALDTSSVIAYLEGAPGDDVSRVDQALASRAAALPAVVLAELLSEPALDAATRTVLLLLPLLEPTPGFWARAGELRAAMTKKGHKARLADTLIAQCCLDYGVSLVTRDRDFRHFRAAGLKLA